MDTEKTNEKLTAKDAVAIVVAAGIFAVSCIAAAKIADVLTNAAVDAVVNTMTLARKRKTAPVEPE